MLDWAERCNENVVLAGGNGKDEYLVASWNGDVLEDGLFFDALDS
jgi:hypothetical protein